MTPRMTTLETFESNPDNLSYVGYKVSSMNRWWGLVVQARYPGYRLAWYTGASPEGSVWTLDLHGDVLLYDYRSATRIKEMLAGDNPDEVIGVVNFADAMRQGTSDRAIHPGSLEALNWPVRPESEPVEHADDERA